MKKVYFYYRYEALDINETNDYTIATYDSSDVALCPIQSVQYGSLILALEDREATAKRGYDCSPVMEGWV